MMGMTGRPVCGVAGIPSTQRSTQKHLLPAACPATTLSHYFHSTGSSAPLAFQTQIDVSPAILMFKTLQTPQIQGKNGILGWLSIAQVLPHLQTAHNIEKFLSLMEEDVNTF